MAIKQDYYIPDQIIVNEEIEDKTGLYFDDLTFDDEEKITIIGTLNCEESSIGKEIVIGAYSQKNDQIIEMSANTFKIRENISEFKLIFDEVDFEIIHIYADYLNTGNSITNTNSESENTYNNFSPVDRLQNSFEIEEEQMKRIGLTIKNLGIKTDVDSLTIFAEIHSVTEKLYEDITINAALYDKNDIILGNASIKLYRSSFYRYEVDEWYFYPVKIPQIEKIKIYPEIR